MATIDKTFLDLPGLQAYDTLIKALIQSSVLEADEVTIHYDSTTNKLSIKNPPTIDGDKLKL